jgi:multiple sugar transport system substrate-binding protein
MNRRLSRLAFTGLAIISLVGCGSAAATGAPTSGPTAVALTSAPTTAPTAAPTTAATTSASVAPGPATEINFWHWATGIDQYVNAFNASHPNIHVNLVMKSTPDDLYAALNTAVTAKTGIPDAIGIEYAYIQNAILHDELTNLNDLGVTDAADVFSPWALQQVSHAGGLYAYPQDVAPTIMLCNKDLLDKNGVTAPTTWAEFESAAAKLHASDSKAYLTNVTADGFLFMALAWNSGAVFTKWDGTNITVNFTSPETLRVADLWDRLIKSGNFMKVDTFSNDWSSAIANQTIACWITGAWGTKVVSGNAPALSGKWMIYQVPQWVAGTAINGMYGGASVAVMKASSQQKAAESFLRWLEMDPANALSLTKPPEEWFPPQKSVFADPAWSDFTHPYFSGQKSNQILKQAGDAVNLAWQWSPLTAFESSTYNNLIGDVFAGKVSYADMVRDWEAKFKAYAVDQGFTVTP